MVFSQLFIKVLEHLHYIWHLLENKVAFIYTCIIDLKKSIVIWGPIDLTVLSPAIILNGYAQS
jgi:hypothetical protein